MSDIEKLAIALQHFAGIDETEFLKSKHLWQLKSYKKGDYFNQHLSVCKHLGFVLSGIFRSYVVDEESGEEKNVFIYPTHQFVVTFRSFINQAPCNYHTRALHDAEILCITINDLLTLYQQSHVWERFGRLLAQEAFNVVIERNESFLFRTPEERYLHLMETQPEIFNNVPLYHLSSYLGIQPQSLSRIRKRITGK